MKTLTLVVGCALAVAVGACTSVLGSDSSSDGSSSSSVASEPVASADPVAARAEQGLKISPVPLDLAGKCAEDVQRIGLGSYLVNALSDCGGCHSSPAGFLAGGNPFFLDAQGDVVWTPNLTPDASTGLSYLTEDQFVDMMRTGKDYRPGHDKMLVVMPWQYFRWMSDADLRSIYAYLRAIPAVSNTPPPDSIAFPLPPSTPFSGTYDEGEVNRPLPPPTAYDPIGVKRGYAIQTLAGPTGPLTGHDRDLYGRGSYLVNAAAICNECHSIGDGRDATGKIVLDSYLAGGQVFKTPPPLQAVFHSNRAESANLSGAQHGFFHEAGMTYATFQAIITTGTHADDTPALPLGWPMAMEANAYKNLLDEDLEAIYTYMTHVPARTGAADVEHQGTVWACNSDADCQGGQTCFVGPTGGECVGASCTSDIDCGACQTCNSGSCAAPLASSSCLANAE